MYKSRKGSPPDENHSGSTKSELIPSSASPEETSRIGENVKKERSPSLVKPQCKRQQENTNAADKPKVPRPKKQLTLDSILIVDDEVERNIRESVLGNNDGGRGDRSQL